MAITTKFVFQVEIPRRTACCAKGQEPLSPGNDFYSVLLEGKDKGIFQRVDYCVTCWSSINLQQTHPNLISYWKAKVPAKKLNDDLPLQRDARVLVLLKQALAHGSNPDEAFVLSLYLARRRLIVLRQELKLPSGEDASIFEVVETEEMLCVPRMRLSELQVEKIQGSLAAQLSGT